MISAGLLWNQETVGAGVEHQEPRGQSGEGSPASLSLTLALQAPSLRATCVEDGGKSTVWTAGLPVRPALREAGPTHLTGCNVFAFYVLCGSSFPDLGGWQPALAP